MDGPVPYARLLRENEWLRRVATAAIRLRHAGRLCDEVDATLSELYANNPAMSRSGTQRLMLDQAYKSEMEAFDKAVADAALNGMDWATEWRKARLESPHD